MIYKVGNFWRKNTSESGHCKESVGFYRYTMGKTMEIEKKEILLSSLRFGGSEYHKK